MLPKFLQSALWSYDLSHLDMHDENDKHLIIEQVLNHGTWEQLKWIRKSYTDAEIIEVITTPSRGKWTKEVLNYWLKFFNLSLSPKIKKEAAFNLFPA